MGQEFGRNFVGCFCLRVFHELAVSQWLRSGTVRGWSSWGLSGYLSLHVVLGFLHESPHVGWFGLPSIMTALGQSDPLMCLQPPAWVSQQSRSCLTFSNLGSHMALLPPDSINYEWATSCPDSRTRDGDFMLEGESISHTVRRAPAWERGLWPFWETQSATLWQRVSLTLYMSDHCIIWRFSRPYYFCSFYSQFLMYLVIFDRMLVILFAKLLLRKILRSRMKVPSFMEDLVCLDQLHRGTTKDNF